jgi:hypothetical protein
LYIETPFFIPSLLPDFPGRIVTFRLTHGFQKLSTKREKLKLTFEIWSIGPPSIEELTVQFQAPQFLIPKEAFEIAMEMPILAE